MEAISKACFIYKFTKILYDPAKILSFGWLHDPQRFRGLKCWV